MELAFIALRTTDIETLKLFVELKITIESMTIHYDEPKSQSVNNRNIKLVFGPTKSKIIFVADLETGFISRNLIADATYKTESKMYNELLSRNHLVKMLHG